VGRPWTGASLRGSVPPADERAGEQYAFNFHASLARRGISRSFMHRWARFRCDLHDPRTTSLQAARSARFPFNLPAVALRTPLDGDSQIAMLHCMSRDRANTCQGSEHP
jgi:hypothetical protein